VILVGAILLAIFVVPAPWGVVLVGAAAVVEVAESAFWIWLSKRRRAAVGAETLVGALAEVASTCRPLGQVRVQGELWRAHCEEGADPGDSVRVERVEGLTLFVSRA
jgi:membrane protein implicated in regulation of membrane protease activity